MQVKKEEMRNALILSAHQAFLEKGFEKASLRQIVKGAGTTIGNFYNYFDSKEMLFEAIVLTDYELLLHLIRSHEGKGDDLGLDFLWHEPNPAIWRKVLGKAIVEMLPEFDRGIVLIFNASEGTRFEGVKQMLVDYMKQHFFEHLEEFGSEKVIGTKEETEAFANLLSTQFVQGFGDIFKLYSGKLRSKMLTEHLLFFMIGLMGLIGDFDTD